MPKSWMFLRRVAHRLLASSLLDLDWAAANRDRILAEWQTRYEKK